MNFNRSPFDKRNANEFGLKVWNFVAKKFVKKFVKKIFFFY